MKDLLAGAARFNRLDDQSKAIYTSQASSQKPSTAFITCSDSRIVPSELTGTRPGSLFIIRNAGNLVPDSSADKSAIAAVEFAVGKLGVQNIVVCGHSNCGAMAGALRPPQEPPDLVSWLKNVETKNCPDADTLSKQNVRDQVEHLSRLSFIQRAVQSGSLQINGWWFDLTSATIYSLSDGGTFDPI